MTAFFGAIADDFTGASDLAALVSRSGVQVRLRLGVPSQGPDSIAPFEIIALKTRTCPPDQAVTESLAALAWLRQAGAQRFFFKYCSTFDSTPNGNIGPVSEALMAALGTSQTIYCPAFPENGRTIFMGTLFVGEQPLAESPMKDHPLTPMGDSSLVRLLARQTQQPVGLANRLVVAQGVPALQARLRDLAESGIRHVIVDAVADADLETIAAACQTMPLLTGGSALAMPLPALYGQNGDIAESDHARPVPFVAPGTVILSGSCSEMTRQQVAHYGGSAFKLDPFDVAKTGGAQAKDWLAAQDFSAAPLIYATADPDEVGKIQQALGRERAGQMIEQCLSELARQSYHQGIRRFIIAGGETSGAVAQALSIDTLLIGPEIASGVPWCYAHTESDPIAIALKSGNFGSARFFEQALKRFPS